MIIEIAERQLARLDDQWRLVGDLDVLIEDLRDLRRPPLGTLVVLRAHVLLVVVLSGHQDVVVLELSHHRVRRLVLVVVEVSRSQVLVLHGCPDFSTLQPLALVQT